jgi:hypothetical protein
MVLSKAHSMAIVQEYCYSSLQLGKSGRRMRQCLAAGTLALSLATVTAHAEEEEIVGSNDRALPAIVHVGAPVPATTVVRVAGAAGYGWFESFADMEGSMNRLEGSIAISVSPLESLTFGLDAEGHYDFYSGGDGGAGTPRLSARYARSLNENFHVGGQFDLSLVGAEAPDFELDAISPLLKGLIAARLAERTWLAAELGFELDMSKNLYASDEYPSTANNLTIGASSSPSIPWGVGVSHRLSGPRTELLSELSGNILVGGNAPGFSESPFRLDLGVRQPLAAGLSLGAVFEVGLSARTDAPQGEDYVPREPRLAGLVTLGWHLQKKEPPPPPPVKQKEAKKEVKPPPPPKPVIETSKATGSIVDEGGRPLTDVEVILTQEGKAPRTTRSLADGRFEFVEIPVKGDVQLEIRTPGYEVVKRTYTEGAERNAEVVMYPALPAGQVRGAVLDLAGNPVVATIEITPGDHEMVVNEDGTFELELAPGRYTVRFRHDDFKNQRRVVVVQDRGVVILNIALSP